MRRVVFAVVAAIAVAGCSSTIDGSAVAAVGSASSTGSSTSTPTSSARSSSTSVPRTTAPARTSAPAAGTATSADLPALVSTVEMFFGALSRQDYASAVGYFDLSPMGGPAPGEPGYDAFVSSFTSGIESSLANLSPGDRQASLAALGTISVDTAQVTLSGNTATVPNAAITSSVPGVSGAFGFNLKAVLLAGGWKIDPLSLG